MMVPIEEKFRSSSLRSQMDKKCKGNGMGNGEREKNPSSSQARICVELHGSFEASSLTDVTQP